MFGDSQNRLDPLVFKPLPNMLLFNDDKGWTYYRNYSESLRV